MSTTDTIRVPATGVAAVHDEWIARAVELADRVIEARRRTKSGTAAWVGPRSAGPGEPQRLISLGTHLYGGTAGIALFLAAAARVTGESRFSDAALDALDPLKQRLLGILADEERAAKLQLGTGGYHGLASMLHGLCKTGELLGRDDYIRDAHRLTALLPRQIEADRTYDLTFGSAGMILVLLSLEKQLGRLQDADLDNGQGRAPVDLALLAADHLLESRVESETGPRAWKTMEERPPLTGFSHGAAGIACALWQLHERTGREDLVEAAREALDYERTMFSAEHGNWRDLRYDEPVYGITWCHGAPGVALGRAHLRNLSDDTAIEEELEIALDACKSGGRTDIDHLCCGNLGRAEILLYAGRSTGREELVDAARDIVTKVVDRAIEGDGFRWLAPGEGDFFDPSFFLGASGIGYTLLRFTDPETLPSVFLLD